MSWWSLRTAMPTRSVSGSQPITMSAWSSWAFSMAKAKAAGSSGLGDCTVGKLPSGVAWASNTCTFLKPKRSSAGGTMVMEVPCRAVKTRFKFAFPIPGFMLNWATFWRYSWSASSPNSAMRSSPPSHRMSSNWTSRTARRMAWSCGGTSWPPSSQYTLYPLYSFGLWEAVKTMPAWHPYCRTEKLNWGVGRREGKRKT